MLFLSDASAQKTQTFQMPEAQLKTAKELFEMQQYGAAKDLFMKIMSDATGFCEAQREEAHFYAAVCACRLHHKDAGMLCNAYTGTYPESIHSSQLYWNLANYRFNSSAYHLALESYERVDEGALDPVSRLEYLFKKGYCYFYENNYDEAKPLFAEVKGTDSPYANKALFYYSHILYEERSYRAAIDGFEKLKEVSGYSSIVPFYIAQIRYAMGEYEKVVAEAGSLLEKSTEKREPEINRIVAQSYYSMGKYKEAIPYMNNYFAKVEMATCEDYYCLGYCHYHEKQYEDAIKCLTRAICRNQDSINQQVYFAIGDCYLQTGRKEFAANTFYAAYELKKDPYLTEDALFTYAKLQYELSANPFSNAISALEKYINEYPKAARRAEAEQYLSDIYLTTKNYQAAIKSLEKMEHRSARLNEAYQRVLCFKGMELYNAGKYAEARKVLSQSMANNYLSEVYSQSLFWMAESFYQEHNYASSVEGYNRFFASEGAARTQEYGQAFYNAGYAHFKERQYSHALTKFQQFESRKGYAGNQRMEADFYNRMGDCCFMLSELDKAQRYYSKTIALGGYDVDYALYQKAASMGGLYRYDEKIALLAQLREQYPASTYTSDA
ncbi:MAG: tetratricopeptide repeat protein, partial [Bacteroidales bacterium]|nr:tetratricopeptide repeat protein [Bacteroidales bacterium]